MKDYLSKEFVHDHSTVVTDAIMEHRPALSNEDADFMSSAYEAVHAVLTAVRVGDHDFLKEVSKDWELIVKHDPKSP